MNTLELPQDCKTFNKIPYKIRNQISFSHGNKCWIWQGFKNKQGYGRIRYLGKKVYVHRLIYSLLVGDIDFKKPIIRHVCDNASCCNPAHLVAGTVQDNIDDRNKRQRQAKGETNGRAKLSKKDVQDIRIRYVPYKITLKELSKEFGVTLDQIHRIVNRKSWRHI